MTDPRQHVFAAARKVDGFLSERDVLIIHAALDAVGYAKYAEAEPEIFWDGKITPRIAAELVNHEAIVQEAYKDSVGVWTWGVGVTNASGHSVTRYKDNPQPIERCLDVYIWLLREKYAPAIKATFKGHDLTEAQFGAALSFHYNTGAITKASWPKLWMQGEIAKARSSFMEWRKPPEIVKRRQAECDLFFDGKWSGDGKATVYPVRKPSYLPNWSGGKRVDVTAALQELLKPS